MKNQKTTTKSLLEKTVEYKTNKGIIRITPETAAKLKRLVLPPEAYVKQSKYAS